jgi:hypothetical protein
VGRAGSPRLTQFDPSEFGAILTDEAHHACAKSYEAIYRHFNVYENKEILSPGVTATVNRFDRKALTAFEEIVYSYSILDGIREGWLVDIVNHRVRTRVRLDDVSSLAGDFQLDELSKAVNVRERNDLIVDAWEEYGQERPTVGFSAGVPHAQALAEEFKSRDHAFEAIWGDDPQRREKLAAHRAGELKGLINFNLLTEGYDDWRVGCIINGRPTESEALYTQMIGRGTRIEDGIGNLLEARAAGRQTVKENLIVIDLVDGCTKHNLASLPSLFGLNPKLDMKGKPVTEVMARVEELQKASPAINLTAVENEKNLEVYAEQVDPFRAAYLPKIIQFSQLLWHKVGDDAYVLLLRNNEALTVMVDQVGNWHIIGRINDNWVHYKEDTLLRAIQKADYTVELLGGKHYVLAATRIQKSDDQAPSAWQIMMCQDLGITIPKGATAGDVRRRMNKVMARRKTE